VQYKTVRDLRPTQLFPVRRVAAADDQTTQVLRAIQLSFRRLRDHTRCFILTVATFSEMLFSAPAHGAGAAKAPIEPVCRHQKTTSSDRYSRLAEGCQNLFAEKGRSGDQCHAAYKQTQEPGPAVDPITGTEGKAPGQSDSDSQETMRRIISRQQLHHRRREGNQDRKGEAMNHTEQR
jgi:hypothetical protein